MRRTELIWSVMYYTDTNFIMMLFCFDFLIERTLASSYERARGTIY